MDDTKVATKTDIKDLKRDLKTDIKDLRADSKSIRGEILRVEERVENLQDEIKTHRAETKNDSKELREEIKGDSQKLDKLQNTLDGFVGRVDNLAVDNEVGTHHTRELELKIENLEKRVKRIESSKATV